jgi:membrane protease subunit HflC
MIPREARIIILVVIFLGLIAVVPSVLFTVNETQQVIITQLGKPVGDPITEAGLYVKVPFIQKANYFEKRILKWDGSPNQIPTRDKKYIWVDTTARWRIKDPLQFLKRVGTVTTAMSRLDGIIDSVVRDHVSHNDLVDLVRSREWEEARQRLSEEERQLLRMEDLDESETRVTEGREKITREMLQYASSLVPEFGIELLDIRIKRINYVESVQKEVFKRMISERKRISAQLRSEGEGERAAILGEMERELAKITSQAYRKSQEIRGEADAKATRIYAEAFGKNPKFFEFYRTLEFYRDFDNRQSTFVLSGDADVFKYLRRASQPMKD